MLVSFITSPASQARSLREKYHGGQWDNSGSMLEQLLRGEVVWSMNQGVLRLKTSSGMINLDVPTLDEFETDYAELCKL